MERIGVIYKLECECSDKCQGRPRYVGQTLHSDKRLRQHTSRKNKSIVGDWVHSHGSRHIILTVLEEVPEPELDARERHWIALLETERRLMKGGLNLTPGGQEASVWSSGGRSEASCKLTLEDVWVIRDEYAQGTVRALELSQRFHVSVSTINDVVRNKTWVDPEYTFMPRPRGDKERLKGAKLNATDVAYIRRVGAEKPARDLARELGVKEITVRRVITGDTWNDEGYTPQIPVGTPVSTLTLEIAREMRALYSEGDYTYPMIAELFGASRSATADILTNRTFKEPK